MSDYLDPDNAELLKDFFSEAHAQVDVLERNILALENDAGNRDAVDELFRAAHTLKGGSATVAFTELSGFTHAVEDLLDSIRSGEVSLDGEMVDSLLSAVDLIKEMLASRSAGRAWAGDAKGPAAALRAYIPSGGKKPPQPHSPAAKKAPAARKGHAEAPAPQAAKGRAEQEAGGSSALSEYEILELKESAGRGVPVLRVVVRFNEDNLMRTVGGIQAFAALKDLGTVLKTLPDFEALYGDNFYPVVEYFVGTKRSPADIRSRLDISDVVTSVDIQEIGDAGAPSAPAPRPQAQAPAAVPVTASPAAEAEDADQGDAPEVASRAEAGPAAQPSPDDEARKEEARRAAAQAGSVLRVDSKRIDNLLNLVSETVIIKATFNQVTAQFTQMQGELQAVQSGYRERMKELFDALPGWLEDMQRGASAKDLRKAMTERYGGLFTAFDGFETGFKAGMAKFRSTAQNLGRVTGELQEGVMRIRMVPISQIFSRFPRLVRDLCKSLGKKVELVIEGEETELDKSVIEDLLDPLMHSVRNALDHGVESPAERAAAGKPEEGMVLLKASNEGNMIVIEVADDGKGIDVESIRAKAVERGLIHPSKSLTDIEAFDLIFQPGFSTARTVTNISGRGVGLDVVRTQIEKLNGSVAVTSQPGKGTRFTIKLPLTLAIIQGLLVRVGKEVYSIPITSVLESHRIKPEEIKFIDNYEVINIRNEVISLLRLDRLFRIPVQEQRDYLFVVIVGTAEKKMGLIVDSLIGEEDVVIKPLRDSFTMSPGIAGASILGDGSVSLIIDVSQLLELGLKEEIEERRRREAMA